MLKFALRNVTRHAMRTGITLAAVTFGVVLLVLSGGFVRDVLIQLREATIHSQLGHIQVQREGFYEFGRRDPEAYLLSQPDVLAAQLVQLTGVVNVMQRLHFTGLVSNGNADLPIVGEGIEADKEANLGTFLKILEGRNLRNDDGYGAIIGQGVAKSLGIKAGDYVTVMSNTLDGSLNYLELEVVGVFQTYSKEFDDRAVRVSLASARELLSTSGAHTLVLHLQDTAFTDAVANQLHRMLDGKGYETMPWHALADFYTATAALYQRQFAVLQLIILIMVVLGVANSVNMAIFERTGEFGTQRAIGDRPGRLVRLILLETAMIGYCGAIFGVALGIALAWVIAYVGIPMPPPPNSNTGYTAYIRIAPDILVLAFLVGFIASALAAILPARHAARKPIVDALRENV